MIPHDRTRDKAPHQNRMLSILSSSFQGYELLLIRSTGYKDCCTNLAFGDQGCTHLSHSNLSRTSSDLKERERERERQREREGGKGSGSGSGWPYAIGLPRRQPHALPVESGRRRSRARLYPEPPIATGGVQPVASLCWQGVR